MVVVESAARLVTAVEHFCDPIATTTKGTCAGRTLPRPSRLTAEAGASVGRTYLRRGVGFLKNSAVCPRQEGRNQEAFCFDAERKGRFCCLAGLESFTGSGGRFGGPGKSRTSLKPLAR